MAKKHPLDDPIWKDERVWQTLYQAGKIADLVVTKRVERLAKTEIGETIYQVCSMYKEHQKQDVETTSDLKHVLNRANFLLTLWRKVSAEEQQRICAGWRIPLNFLTPGALCREWQGVYSETDDYLILHCDANNVGQVSATIETQMTECGTDLVRVLVRSGATREEMMTSMISAMQTLNAQWETLIAMPSVTEEVASMTANLPAPPSSVGAEKKPRTESQKPTSKLGGKNGKVAAVAA